MSSKTPYASITPDESGRYPYTPEDASVWSELFTRQIEFLQGKMVPDYFEGIEKLELSAESVPQVIDIDARLSDLTGAGVEGVPAIIPPTRFFTLLSERKFPVATFLRRREDIDYIEEPDLFHEVFGHCPLLTNPSYCDFIEGFGKRALELGKPYSWHMFRLFWFTIEFGMIQTPDGLRGYGAGIASSPSEAAHATGPAPLIQPFDILQVLRTPYRIDIVQPTYFAISDFDQLAALMKLDIAAAIDKAKALGDLPPMFDEAA